MLKREITYEDFDGNSHTEVFYFNLSKPELIELETEFDKGLSVMLQDIVKSEDNNTIIKLFKRIVLMSYGERSEDGKRFIKTPQMQEEFSQTNAFNELFIELATDAETMAAFVSGVLPKDLAAQAEKAIADTADPTVELPQTTNS